MSDETKNLFNALRGGSIPAIPAPPPPPPPLEVKGLWYNGKTIKLDGWMFESCRFDNCVLVVSSPFINIKNCYLDDTNVIQYGGMVLKVIQLFNYHAGFEVPPEFTAVKGPDGTISIGG